MSRIDAVFEHLKRDKRPALIPFITAGDPDYERSQDMLNGLPAAGADIIELGMAFTDPVADGEAIQAANIRALDAGASIAKTLDMVRAFRANHADTPIVLMGYCNPIDQYGMEAFANDAADAGVDGLILVDMPPEESAQMVALCDKAGLHFIRLITPTTDEARLKIILDGASGFLYYVSVTGVTGSGTGGSAKPDPKVIADHLTQIRAQTDLPIAVGFGIKTPADAAAFKGIADAVVVGSALVRIIEQNVDAPDLSDKLHQQARALADGLV